MGQYLNVSTNFYHLSFSISASSFLSQSRKSFIPSGNSLSLGARGLAEILGELGDSDLADLLAEACGDSDLALARGVLDLGDIDLALDWGILGDMDLALARGVRGLAICSLLGITNV